MRSMFASFANYIRGLEGTSLEDWACIIFVSVALYIVSLLAIKMQKKKSIEQNHFLVLKGIFIGSAFVIALLIGIIIYYWAYTDYYIHHSNHFIHYICIILAITVGLSAFITLRNKFVSEKSKHLIQQPYTRNEQGLYTKNLIRVFKRLKFFAVIPALSFLLLLFNENSEKLVTFLLDNSSSMEDELETGRTALTRTINELDNGTRVIFSYLTENKGCKKDIKTIIRADDHHLLNGQSFFFPDREQAISFLNDRDNIPITGGTPLYECIWSTFLYTKSEQGKTGYKQSNFFIISDGGEGHISNDPQFESFKWCESYTSDNNSLQDVFDNVIVINLGGNLGSSFFTNAEECGFAIEDGSSLDSYIDSLDRSLKEYKRDWNFIIWIAIFYGIFLVAVILLNPKR